MKILLHLLGLVISFSTADAQTPKNLTLLGSLSFPGQTLAGCWHYNDNAGNEYALVGAQEGIAIVDITQPASPALLFQLPGASSLWHEVKVLGDYAYAVSEGTDQAGIKNGLQIIDLRFLPDSAPSVFYQGDGAISNQLISANSVTVDDHYVFVNGHNISALGSGVIILDVSDPLVPVYKSSITARYCHDSFVTDNLIFTSDIRDGLFTVYDIGNISSPVMLATQNTPGDFNHNTWVSDDHHTLFTTDERNNQPLAAFDITNTGNITLIDTFYNGNFKSSEVHNVRVFNNYLVNPSYGSQLTLADVQRPANIIEVGNYTTGSSLCWDADPYTNSGVIIATDMSSGTLFCFHPEYRRACYLEGVVTDSSTGQSIFKAQVALPALAIVDSSNLAGEYKTGYADSGTYTVEVSKAGYFSKTITVSLVNGVLTTLDIQLVPLNNSIDDLSGLTVDVYPNPAGEYLNVHSLSEVESWKITDVTGKTILDSAKPSAELFTIDISSLPSGQYFFNAISGNGKFTKLVQVTR